MVKHIILLLILISTTLWPADTDEITVTAHLSKTSTPLNQAVQLSVSLKGSHSPQSLTIKLPDLSSDFRELSRSESSSFSWVNGEMTYAKTTHFMLFPLKKGELSIPKITIEHNNSTYETDVLHLTVTNATGAPITTTQTEETSPKATIETHKTDGPKKAMLSATITKNTIYVGEETNYTLTFYRRIRLWSNIQLEAPSFTNAWTQDTPIQEEHITTLDNERYYSLELINKRLSPLEAGVYTIAPSKVAFAINPFSPHISLESETVTINVLPLPEGAPNTFTGAIGQFSLSSKLDKTTAIQNTPLILTLTVTGTGNSPQIQDLQFDKKEKMSIYKSKVSTQINPDTELTERVFEYFVVPEEAGSFEVPEFYLSYFSIDDETYHTVTTNVIPIQVLQNDTTAFIPSTTETNSANPQTSNIRYLKPNKSPLSPKHYTIVITILALLNITWGGYIVRAKVLQIKHRKNPQYKTQQNAYKNAKHHLLKISLDIHKHPDTLSKTGDILLKFISDKTGILLSGKPHATIKQLLSKTTISQGFIDNIIETLNQLDYLRYTDTIHTFEERKAFIQNTLKLIQKLQREFK